MSVLAINIKESQQSPLQWFIGDNAREISHERVDVTRYVQADILEVCFPENDMPEEQGRLHLFPVDDAKFCLQLLYLQHSDERSYTANVHSIRFLPAFFEQYPTEALMANQPFRFDQTTEQQFSICALSRALLEQLQAFNDSTPFIRILQLSETSMQLLRRALQCITQPFNSCQLPTCRFLAYESEREKVMEARNIIEQHFDKPLTIRELSRKVAMNECYLKKGFKALVGKAINEYQQDLRIAKAKELLQQQGQSVSDVADTLGYSSISHFSTAFKKATGIKPCELLQ